MKSLSRLMEGAALAALVGAAGAGHAASDTFVYEIVSGWTVHTDRARDFSCSMEARYEGGSVIRLGFDEGGDSMYLVVGDPAWAALEVGRRYEAEVAVGDESAWASRASAVVMDEEAGLRGLRVDLGPDRGEAVTRRLMREYSVTVGYDGGEPLELSLGGSYQAGLKLTECQEAMAELRDRSGPASETQAEADTLSAGR